MHKSTQFKLKFDVRNVYGRILAYPACELSKYLCDVFERKALSEEQLKKLHSGDFFVIEYKVFKIKDGRNDE